MHNGLRSSRQKITTRATACLRCLRGEWRNSREQVLRLEGFREYGRRSESPRHLEEISALNPAPSGYRNDRSLGPHRAQFQDRLDALLLRHDDVGHNEIRPTLSERIQPKLSISGASDRVTLVLQYRPHRHAR